MDEETKRNLKKMSMPLYGGFACVLASFLLNLLAFSSPYWLESYPETNSAFLRMGIWEVCFDGYLHPQDARANVWRGCFWIFDRRFLDTKLWYYLDPPWMIAVQVLSVISFLCHIVAALTMILYFLYFGQPAAESIISWICELASGILMFIVVCVFGHFSEDRSWMPRPDHNHLSWSYAFAVLGCVLSFGACIFLSCLARTDRAMEKEYEYMERFGAFGQDPGFGTGYSGGHGQASLPYRAASPMIVADPMHPSEKGYRPSGVGSIHPPGPESIPPAGPGSVASSRHQTYTTGRSTVHVPMSGGHSGPGSSVA